jgi:hypothetical protein
MVSSYKNTALAASPGSLAAPMAESEEKKSSTFLLQNDKIHGCI